MIKNDYGGLFIAFDGPNGVGKSTLIEYVQAALSESGMNVWVTKEPTDTQLGKFTRQIAETLGGEGLTCLVSADRYQHLINEIIPKLEEKRLYDEIIKSGREISMISSNTALNIQNGRSQFNFHSGNYSQIDDNILNEYIIKTQKLSEVSNA